MDIMYYFLGIALALAGAPLLSGIINCVKAFFAGRRGPSVFQLYYDMAKLLRKQPICSHTATWIFQAGPSLVLVSTLCALILLPQAGAGSPLGFTGDLFLFLYLCGTGRLFTVLAAMDTGSAFEGMGSSRECQFALFGEGAFIAVFGTLSVKTGALTLDRMLTQASWTEQGTLGGVSLALLLVSLFCVVLLECCRVPVDDPETHLELTMIHEVMILDNSGYDLALTHYAASLKMWMLLQVLALIALPKVVFSESWLAVLCQCAAVLFGAVLIGVIESIMGRSRFLKLPQMLAAATVLALVAMILCR